MNQLNQALAPYLGLLLLLALAVALAALAAVFALSARLNRIAPNLRRLAKTVEGKDAETVFREQLENVMMLDRRVGQLNLALEELRQHHLGSVTKVGLYRYDATDKMGGKLSFSLCLLDGHDNGVMLCSIYRLEDCQIYARQVTAGKTARPLSKHEQSALEAALASAPETPTADSDQRSADSGRHRSRR